MISKIFTLIQLVLQLFKLWDLFLDHMDANYSKEIEERRQAREKALNDLSNAQTEDDFDKAQDAVTGAIPKP